MKQHKTYLIKRETEGEAMYLESLEMGQFGTRVGFRHRKSEAILFLTYYEAAATMCFIVEQIDGDLTEELTIITLQEEAE